MKITNNFGLPQPLVNAVTFSDYKKPDNAFSVTELLLPPQLAALRLKHDSEIEEDASERIWLLLGSAGHEVLRRSAKSGIVEETITIELGGAVVKGQSDYVVTDDTLWDYKFTSVWAVKEGARDEWIQQLNCYRFMLSKYGVSIKKLTIVALLRDWSLPESKRNADYPQSQVKVIELPLWDDATTEKFLLNRIALHTEARKGNPVECSDEDRWFKPPKFAAMKSGAARATKLFDVKSEAEQFAASKGLIVETRPGENARCESYCPVSQFCSQFKALKGA